MNYPERYCASCGARLVPKITAEYGRKTLERPSAFRARKGCDHDCGRAAASKRLTRVKRTDGDGAVVAFQHLTDRAMSLVVEFAGMPLRVVDFSEVLGVEVGEAQSALRSLVRTGRDVGRREDPDGPGFLYFWKPSENGHFHQPNGEAVSRS